MNKPTDYHPNGSGTVNDMDNQEISVLELFEIFLQKWPLIAVFAVIGIIVACVYTKISTIPTYTSQGTLYVNTQKEQLSSNVDTNAIEGAVTLMPTYIEILNSKTFLTRISNEITNTFTPSQINRMTHMSAVKETNLLTIACTSVDTQDAYTLCSTLINEAPDEILRVFEGGSVKIIDLPEVSTVANRPSTAKRGLLGAAAGMFAAALLIFIMHMTDTRIKSSGELSAKYKLPILGETPKIEISKGAK